MIYRYFVEGECEKKFIDCFKSSPLNYYISGKTIVFNVLTKKINSMYLRDLTDDTTIIFVYDTDKINPSYLNFLQSNHYFCCSFKKIKNVVHLQSIKNFEDEIIYCSIFKKITDVFGSEGTNEFKKMFLHCTNLCFKLNTENFNFKEIWTRNSDNQFSSYSKYKMKISLI